MVHHRHSVGRRWEKGWGKSGGAVVRSLLEGSLGLRCKIILTCQELSLLRSVVLLNVGSVPRRRLRRLLILAILWRIQCFLSSGRLGL